MDCPTTAIPAITGSGGGYAMIETAVKIAGTAARKYHRFIGFIIGRDLAPSQQTNPRLR
jgi:hypothetical protein